MTKAEFKKQARAVTYNGFNGYKKRINAFYFDWQEGEDISVGRQYRGFKYRISSDVKNITKAKLLDLFYDWVENGTNLPYYVDYRFAHLDIDRFKVSLSL